MHAAKALARREDERPGVAAAVETDKGWTTAAPAAAVWWSRGDPSTAGARDELGNTRSRPGAVVWAPIDFATRTFTREAKKETCTKKTKKKRTT